ncbi:g9649 [Coccomyxa viridis]|uniref:G9649 protein n=1 Tax=Coccomyxa viridis TaxID=1274662 RepID=A0ABP1G3U9_9CHLO
MSKSGPDGPARAVIEGKIAEAKEGRDMSDYSSGDRIRQMEDTTSFSSPQAEERITAAAAGPGSKEPQPMPEAAQEALNSKEEFNASIPKRHT